MLRRFDQDMFTAGSSSTREVQLRTWALFHHEWFRGAVDLLPLTSPGFVVPVCDYLLVL